MNDEDRRALLGIYTSATLELIAAMKAGLAAWESAPDRDRAIGLLLAQAHRLRGDSSGVGIASSVELVRGCEALLRALRAGEVAHRAEHGDLLAEVLDQVAEIATAALHGESEHPSGQADLLARLKDALAAS